MDFKDLKYFSSLGPTSAADFEESTQELAKNRKLRNRRCLFKHPRVSTPKTNQTFKSRDVASNKVKKPIFTLPFENSIVQTTVNQMDVGHSSTKYKIKDNKLESPLFSTDGVVESPYCSLTDFEKLEETLKNEENEKMAESSSISSVCNLLKRRNINTIEIEKSYTTKNKNPAKLIQDAICAEKKYFKNFEDTYYNIMRQMELALHEYKSKQEENMELLGAQLKSLSTPLKNIENCLSLNSKNRQSAKAFKDLRPLCSLGLTAADFEESMQEPSKKRKLEHKIAMYKHSGISPPIPTTEINGTFKSSDVASNKVKQGYFTLPFENSVVQTTINNQFNVGHSSSNCSKKRNKLESPPFTIYEVEESSCSPTDTMIFVELEEMLKNEENEKMAQPFSLTSAYNLLKVTNTNSCEIQDSYTKKKEPAKLIQNTTCKEKKLLSAYLKSSSTPLKKKENESYWISRRSESPIDRFNTMIVSSVPKEREKPAQVDIKKERGVAFWKLKP